MDSDLGKYNPEGSELRSLQLKMLSIMTTVTNIAEKHNIPYWLSGGTLLGAVRHGGFIPWDDDMDIEVLRSDYVKLLKLLKKELPSDLYLQTPKDKGYRLLFTKVRDRRSVVHEEDSELDDFEEKGIYIDIIPEERSYKFLKQIVDFFYGRAYRRLKRGKPFQSFQYFYEFSLSLILYPIGFVLMWISRAICELMKPNRIFHSYGIGMMTSHKESSIFPLGKVTFEGREFPAPANPDAYLTEQYGNYMSIPPEDKRETHIVSIEYKYT